MGKILEIFQEQPSFQLLFPIINQTSCGLTLCFEQLWCNKLILSYLECFALYAEKMLTVLHGAIRGLDLLTARRQTALEKHKKK